MTTTQTAPSPFAQPWPEGVTHRYENLVGAAIDISRSPKTGNTLAACKGCPWEWSSSSSVYAHSEAQAHAEKCRALPRPAVTG